MALNRRQQRLYKDVVTIYRPKMGAIGAQSQLNDPEYELVAQGVYCHFYFTSEYAEARASGRTKVNNLFTFDKVHFEDAVEIEDAYVLVLNSSPSQFNVGGYWICQSNPLSVPASGRRKGNYQEVFAARTVRKFKGIV